MNKYNVSTTRKKYELTIPKDLFVSHLAFHQLAVFKQSKKRTTAVMMLSSMYSVLKSSCSTDHQIKLQSVFLMNPAFCNSEFIAVRLLST